MKTHKLLQTASMRLLFALLIATIMCSCTQQNDSQLEGAWEMVYLKGISSDTLQYEFPGNVSGSQIKMWSKDHFTFMGRFRLDTTTQDNYGGGTYTMKDSIYKENIIYHMEPDYIGQEMRIGLEIRNDTLIQTYPLAENGEIDENNYFIEKYVRLD